MQSNATNHELAANEAAMRQHLDALFSPVSAEYPEGLLEIRAVDPGKSKAPRPRMFPVNANGRAAAVEFALRQNTEGFNVYVGLNPRIPGTNRNSAGTADDVEIAFFGAVDCDTATASEALCRFVDDCEQPAPSFLVLTGTVPSARLHSYWALDGAIRNHTSREAIMRGLAARFAGDAIHDAPRILRLAGSISYPSKGKVERGYIVEQAQFSEDPTGEAVPVTIEELRAAFPTPCPEPRAPKSPPANGNSGETPALAKLSDAELSRLFDLLPNDVDRDPWSNICLAIKNDLGDVGFRFFDQWSKRHESYDERETRRV